MRQVQHGSGPPSGPPPPAIQYVSERVVAEILDVSVRTVQDWRLREGGPPCYQLEGAIRYDLLEVLDWASNQRFLLREA